MVPGAAIGQRKRGSAKDTGGIGCNLPEGWWSSYATRRSVICLSSAVTCPRRDSEGSTFEICLSVPLVFLNCPCQPPLFPMLSLRDVSNSRTTWLHRQAFDMFLSNVMMG